MFRLQGSVMLETCLRLIALNVVQPYHLLTVPPGGQLNAPVVMIGMKPQAQNQTPRLTQLSNNPKNATTRPL